MPEARRPDRGRDHDEVPYGSDQPQRTPEGPPHASRLTSVSRFVSTGPAANPNRPSYERYTVPTRGIIIRVCGVRVRRRPLPSSFRRPEYRSADAPRRAMTLAIIRTVGHRRSPLGSATVRPRLSASQKPKTAPHPAPGHDRCCCCTNPPQGHASTGVSNSGGRGPATATAGRARPAAATLAPAPKSTSAHRARVPISPLGMVPLRIC